MGDALGSSVSAFSGAISFVAGSGLDVTTSFHVSGFVTVSVCTRVSVLFSVSVGVSVDRPVPFVISVSVSGFASVCVCVSVRTG